MDSAEIRQVVEQVLAAEREQHAKSMDDIAIKTMATILAAFGIDADDTKEIRADFQHLRSWRKSVELVQTTSFKTAVGILVTGTLAALWLGIQAHQHTFPRRLQVSLATKFSGARTSVRSTRQP